MTENIEDLARSSEEPHTLEAAYRAAQDRGETEAFTAAMVARYQTAPDNPLYAAWYYRLQEPPAQSMVQAESEAAEEAIAWRTALPLALISGLLFALLANTYFIFIFQERVPDLLWLWSPVVALLVYLFLMWANPRYRQRALPALGGVMAAGAYVVALSQWIAGQDYLILMIFHLPLLAWLGVGLGLVGWASAPRERFAGLIKTLEIGITGGVFGIGMAAFSMITVGLFEALGLRMPPWMVGTLFAGGAGLVPVIAVAVAFQPQRPLVSQRFEQGLGRLAPILMRLLLPLTLLVLVVYLCFIPFNFMGPFRHRELLVVYNAMLFAVMVLLVGATPVHEGDLPDRFQRWLRTAILAVATLSVLISLYALAAVVYRTALGGLTPNRLTVIGWNAINISLLIALIYRQWRGGAAAWVDSLQRVASTALVIYAAWALFLVLALPFLFPGV